MISESVFQAALERALNAPGRGTRVDRANAGDLTLRTRDGSVRRFRGAQKGTGDLVGFVIGEGWHLEVECKSAKGRSSPEQVLRAAAAKRFGWIYVKVVAGDEIDISVRAALLVIDAAIGIRRYPTIRTRAQAIAALGEVIGGLVADEVERVEAESAPAPVVDIRTARRRAR